MNEPVHHIPEETLAAYATGHLDEAFGLVVATHLSLCDTCRATVAGYEAVGGIVLDDCDQVEMGDDALAATMALIDGGFGESDTLAKPVAAVTSDPVLPEPLISYVKGGAEAIKWRSLGGGVKQAILDCEGRSTARLMLIPGGAQMPDHSHQGLEVTMVLQGAFADEEDRYGRGDVDVGDENVHHAPMAEAGQDCICLIATNAPLKFDGLIPRMLQPLFRI